MQQYQPNFKNIYISLKYLRRNILLLPFLMLLSIPIAYYIKGYSWSEAIQIGPIVNLTFFIFLGLLPTLMVHFNHYRANKNLSVQINPIEGVIAFSSEVGKKKETFEVENLKISQHLSYFHDKSTKLFKYISTPWSNYSYLKIETVEGETFYISSTMVTIDHLPIQPTEKHYTFWPIIKNK